MKTLKEIPCGETARVKKLTGEGPVKRRIMDMGITKGVDVFVRKVAPLGDPVEITVSAQGRCGNDFGGIDYSGHFCIIFLSVS